MDKILEEAVNNIVEIFIIDVENVALAKGAVSKILKELVEEKFTSTNKQSTPCPYCEGAIRQLDMNFCQRCGRVL